jgi:hypothetical protein
MGKTKLSILVLVLAALGCSKDITQQEYKRQLALEDLAQYQAVEGRYSGIVTSKAVGKVGRILGGLELVIQARLNSDGGAGGSGASGGSSSAGGTPGGGASATLLTELHFQDTKLVRLVAQSGYYDPDTGVYQTQFQIPTQDGKFYWTLSVTGHIGSNHIVGTIQGVGDEEYGGTFELEKDGTDIATLGKAAKPTPTQTAEGQTWVFKSQQRFDPSDKQDPPIQMSVNEPTVTGAEHFVELFLPDTEKVLSISLNLNDLMDPIPFNSTTWDTVTGDVTTAPVAIQTGPNSTFTPHLQCSDFFLTLTKQPFTCYYWSDRSSRIAILFQPKANVP